MPSYVFTLPPHYMPSLRDASGQPIGDANPGDIHEFDEPPPVPGWEPLSDEVLARIQAQREADAKAAAGAAAQAEPVSEQATPASGETSSIPEPGHGDTGADQEGTAPDLVPGAVPPAQPATA